MLNLLVPTRHKDPRNDRSLGAWLARWFELAVHPRRELPWDAWVAMKEVAEALVYLLVFEVCAWTTNLNMILHQDPFQVSWSRTPLAVLFGLIIGRLVMQSEKSLFRSPKPRNWVGYRGFCVRFFFILASAGLTAQVLHMLVFSAPIAERAAAEQYQAEAVQVARRVLESQSKAVETRATDTHADPRVQALLSERDGVRAQLDALADEVTSEQGRKHAAVADEENARKRESANWTAWRAATEPEDQDRFAGAANHWASRKATAARAGQQALGRLEGLEQRKVDLKVSEVDLTARIDALLAELGDVVVADADAWEVQAASLRTYLDRVQKARPGDEPVTWTSPQGEVRSFQFVEYHYFQRLRVLEDLKDGRRPVWPLGELDADEVDYLRDHLKLSPEAPSEPAALARWELQEVELQRAARRFTLQYWLVFVVGAFIPMMVVTRKLFQLPPSLELYYESDEDPQWVP